ncbi:hypothetical protein [Stakelama pacifica]|uniref:DUF4350 domain-containing protein n=1 Tax=Stakelama pacifica TaxID=517720 RepID=A0A4R6FCV5_9SPHN|nr:hypothetical protein [Stakelama pacifica]TDN79061.1 hypothetical protein EV664_11497 [Stakelama pacifica]
MSAISSPRSESPFTRAMVLVLIGAGLLLGIGFLLMSGFRDELSNSFDRPPPVETRSGEGFYGLRRLIDLMPRGETFLVESAADQGATALLILTPEVGGSAQDLHHILAARTNGSRPTLIVLPKWQVSRTPFTRNRVKRTGPIGSMPIEKLLGRKGLSIRFESPAALIAPTGFVRHLPAPVPGLTQTIDGEGIEPLITTTGKGIVLGRLTDEQQVYILADPDILNNRALKTENGARAALDMVGALNPADPGFVGFDTTLHYRPGERNLIKLMFLPPFVAVTIAILAAALMAIVAGAARFGPVRREARAVVPGKRALADNIAALTRLAGKTHRAGNAYADWVRDWTARRLHAPAGLNADQRADWLDARSGDADPKFTDLAMRARDARNDAALLDAARDLDDWRREMTE